MKYLNLILFCIILPFSCFSESVVTDDLSTTSQTSPEEKKIHALYELAEKTKVNDTSLAKIYIEEGILLSRYTGYKQGVIQGMLKLAIIDKDHGKDWETIDKALQILHMGVPLLKKDSVSILSLLGNSMGNLGANEMAIEFRKKELEMLDDKTGKDAYYITENIAYYFDQLQMEDSANFYMEKAGNIASNTTESAMKMHYYNNMGHKNYKKGNLIKAKAFFFQAIETFNNSEDRKNQDSVLYGLVNENLGQVFAQENNYSLAITHLNETIRIFKLSNYPFIDYIYISMAEFHINIKDYENAESYLNKVNINNYGRELQSYYYETLALYYQETNQQFLQIEALAKQIKSLESRMGKSNVSIGKVDELIKHQINNIKKESEILEKKRNDEKKIYSLKLQRIIVIGASLLILIGILLVKYRSDIAKRRKIIEANRKLNKEKLKNTELENRQLANEIEYKNKDLTDFAIDLTRKQELLEGVLTRLKKLKKDPESSHLLNETILYIKNQTKVSDELIIFQENVDKVNHKFMKELSKKYPSLSTTEMQLSALLRLNLSSKEIASIKNISADSVKTMRYRIRKKIGIPKSASLTLFLKGL